MDELELFDSPLMDVSDTSGLLFRFLFNAFFVWIIIHMLYYPKSRRSDYYFTFAVISVSVFFMIYLLSSVKIKVGFALGLFAIFGIIRYRTESMSVREMTYLFVVITVSVINALAVTLSYAELVLTNCLFIASIWACEYFLNRKRRLEKLVLYDRVDLIVPERKQELLDDLTKRLGIKVEDVQVGSVDFLRDTAMLRIYYKDPVTEHSAVTDNMVNYMMKLPKEGQ